MFMVSDLAVVRRQAEEAEQKEEWEQASLLRDSIVLQSTRAGFWDRLFAVRAVMYAGRIDDALNRLRLLANASGTESACAMMRAEIEERRGCDVEAVQWWRKAASLQSDPYWA